MNKGKILKVRPGHDANCSSYAYMGGILIGLVGYVALFGILVFVLLHTWSRRLGSELGKGGKMVLWFVPNLLALSAFLYWAFTSGAMDYGSIVCVGPVALVMLIGMVGGWAKLAARVRAAQRAASILCPGCGRQVGLGLRTCPTCGFDLAPVHLALIESRDAAEALEGY